MHACMQWHPGLLTSQWDLNRFTKQPALLVVETLMFEFCTSGSCSLSADPVPAQSAMRTVSHFAQSAPLPARSATCPRQADWGDLGPARSVLAEQQSCAVVVGARAHL
jgi:hypothetical protein